jgi:hypothetical protein
MKPDHTNVDRIWSNVQSVKKTSNELMKLFHHGRTDGSGVIDDDHDVKGRLTSTNWREGDGRHHKLKVAQGEGTIGTTVIEDERAHGKGVTVSSLRHCE